MLQTIIDAIKNRRVLSFIYDGYHRVVEPHAVGSSTAGNDVLRCYQTEGGHVTLGHDWDLCELSKISTLQLTGGNFANARPDYKKGDKGMSRIYAEL
jgi:hypothetical protein